MIFTQPSYDLKSKLVLPSVRRLTNFTLPSHVVIENKEDLITHRVMKKILLMPSIYKYPFLMITFFISNFIGLCCLVISHNSQRKLFKFLTHGRLSPFRKPLMFYVKVVPFIYYDYTYFVIEKKDFPGDKKS